VPTSTTQIQIEYLDALRVRGLTTVPVVIVPDGVAEISDPDFQDVAATLLRLEITGGAAEIPLGIESQFEAQGFFNDGTSRPLTASVTWSVMETGIATVTEGRVQGLQAGPFRLKASLGALEATRSVTITPAVLRSIQVTPASVSLAKGTSDQLTATGLFTDGTSQPLTTQVSWESSDGAVAVSPSGEVTALSQGSATITARMSGIEGSSSITVTPAVLRSIQVTPASLSLAKGTTDQLTATGLFSDGTSQPLTTQVSWESSDGAVAVSATGEVTALSQGSATITARMSGIEGSSSLTVTPAVLRSIQVTPASLSLAKGTSDQLTATGLFSDGTSQPLTTQVSWESSDGAVAVSPSGEVTALSQGSATITARMSGIEGSSSLTVTPAVAQSLLLSPVDSAVLVGDNLQLRAQARLSDGTLVEVTNLANWQSRNTSRASVGAATGLVQGVALGDFEVQASYQGVSATLPLVVGPGAKSMGVAGAPLFASVSFDGQKVAHFGVDSQIYRFDSQTGQDQLVSFRSPPPGLTYTFPDINGNIQGLALLLYDPSISGDGEKVVFNSFEPGVTTVGPSDFVQIYWRNLTDSALVRVTQNALGEPANGHSFHYAVSRDGRKVVFSSSASNLVPGDTNGVDDIFVKDIQSGEIRLVSRDSQGNLGNGASGGSRLFEGAAPSISADGRFVAFDSNASNLVAGDSNGENDVFVHDCLLGTTESVNLDDSDQMSSLAAYAPRISDDGNLVFFHSRNNLVAADTNGKPDIYVRNRSLARTELVSTNSSGVVGDDTTGIFTSIAISADGRYVAFESKARNFVPSAPTGNLGFNLYVKDRTSGKLDIYTRLPNGSISQAALGADQPLISGNGQFLYFGADLATFISGGVSLGPQSLIRVWNRLFSFQ
jgi:uncharacterized protein YjdB